MHHLQPKKRLRLNYICAALLAGTGTLSAGLAGAQISAIGTGVSHPIPANTVINTGTTDLTYALLSQNGGQLTAQGPVSLTTGGIRAHAAVADGQNATISLLQGLRVSTTGVGSVGVSSNGGFVAIRPGAAGQTATITTTGVSAHGLFADASGSIDANGVSVTTSGDAATGARAQDGASLSLSNSSLTTNGPQAYGLLAQGAGTTINAVNLKIATMGAVVGATSSNGIVSEFGANITVKGATTVTTTGNSGIGLLSQVGGGSNQPDTVLSFNGDAGASIITHGDFAAGAEACSRPPVTSPDCTAPLGSDVAGMGANAVLNINNTSVTTQGASSYGLYSFGQAATVNAQNLTVATSGADAHAAVVRNGGALNVADSSLSTTGANAAGLYMTSPAGVTGTADLSKVSLTAAQGPSIKVDGGAANIALANANALVNNGQWLNVAATAQANPSLANVVASQSNVTGAASTAPGATANLTLANNSLWNMTGDSNLTRLTNNGSAVLFAAPTGSVTSASSYKTLTVNNYAGQGGTLGLNSYLGGDGSPSDRLVINGGSALGSTALRINNTGGAGALTVGNGIQVVQAANGGTTNAGAFTLSTRVVGGPYEYSLYKGTPDASDAQGWYLRSTREVEPGTSEPIPPELLTPNQLMPGQPGPSQPGATQPGTNQLTPNQLTPGQRNPVLAPRYRPEVAVYQANQQAAEDMLVHSLHDRLGEPQWIENQRSGEANEKRNSTWLRVVTRSTRANNEDGGLSAKTEGALLQGGGEVAQWDMGGPQGRLHLGGMVGYGSSSTRARAADNPIRASGKVEGWNLGAYGTWYQNDEKKLGWYTDVWGSYGWFKNTVNGEKMAGVKYNSTGWALSGETGYAFKPLQGKDWVLEPQAQVIYLNSNQDDVVEDNGTRISNNGNGGWISRVGVRNHAVWINDDGTRTEPFVTVNWWRHSTNNNMEFSQIAAPGMYPKDRYEVKLGVNTDLSKGWSGWVNVGRQWGKQDFESFIARIGAKYTW